jgi:hypothetical protein
MATEERDEPQQEYFENVATDVEVEESDAPGSGAAKPWDPSKIRISTKPFSLRQVVDMIDDHDIDLAPDFQRLYVWKALQRSRLIESILLGIPLPAFYFNQDHQGLMQVVDGVQRLTTIYRFVKRGDVLSDLEYLKVYNGKAYDQLDGALKRRFQQTQIFVNVIEPQTPDDVKFDVFRRINTGGSPLTSQEIRHCMSRDRSRSLLKRLVESAAFIRATGAAFRSQQRMADREVAQRFCAFRMLSDIDEYRSFSSLDSFLLDFTRQVDGAHADKAKVSDECLAKLESEFERAMINAVAIFDNAAFRKYPTDAVRRGPVNRALFESWAVVLADYELAQLEPHKHEIYREAREWMRDPAYIAATSQGTGDPNRVKLRFEVPRKIIDKALAREVPE